MYALGHFGVEGEAELFLPVEFVAGLREGRRRDRGHRAASGHVGSMGGDLVRNHAGTNIFLIGVGPGVPWG